FKDQGRRHLVVGLKRPMERGEALEFEVEREAMEAFTQDEEWIETLVDHPVDRLGASVIFPKERPVQRAVLLGAGAVARLPIFELHDGRTLIGFHLNRPQQDTPYTIRWSW